MSNANSDIRFKTTSLKPSLCDHIDPYILVKERNTIAGDVGQEPDPNARRNEAQLSAAIQADERNKE